MDIGFHIANFTWNVSPDQLAPTFARAASEADASGIKRITVMDHFWQIGTIGTPEQPMLEGYTALGFLAAHTSSVLLHTLVTGVIYREPGILAKQISTLDVLSGGRAGLGIGAGWNEEESKGLGIPFPPTKERFERLEEALQICLQMWSGDEGPYDGEHYHLGRTLNSPQPLSKPRPYLMIGGVGEQKTLRYVARYADACNIFGSPEAAHKLDVLRHWCDVEGRDYDTVEKTTTTAIHADTDLEAFVGQLDALRELGFTAAYVSARTPDPLKAVEFLGRVAERVS
ncbi:LLM class F420-dependent oxidoreductase [Humibacter ginsenosidimutans]|uniref:LLM class F420-dependent oxidoreductase n=1 Tax=Humibacter ginsenosidimutans TaxID=2599293 RepID=A0A5B8M4A1_9MICO|nr:LLM class F420-dependent oxidoreductase [Humibacter ginsenosidimutans]QDZ14605.1 LLM class F420-dependent oxidoreductase [Humibacter ginsenosidimutans]